MYLDPIGFHRSVGVFNVESNHLNGTQLDIENSCGTVATVVARHATTTHIHEGGHAHRPHKRSVCMSGEYKVLGHSRELKARIRVKVASKNRCRTTVLQSDRDPVMVCDHGGWPTREEVAVIAFQLPARLLKPIDVIVASKLPSGLKEHRLMVAHEAGNSASQFPQTIQHGCRGPVPNSVTQVIEALRASLTEN